MTLTSHIYIPYVGYECRKFAHWTIAQWTVAHRQFAHWTFAHHIKGRGCEPVGSRKSIMSRSVPSQYGRVLQHPPNSHRHGDDLITLKSYTSRYIIIKINNQPLDVVTKTKFLGVIIDSKLSWKEHALYTS